MFKWLLSKLFPPLTPRELHIMNQIKELNENGVRIEISERGGWRVEFDNEEAKKWYYGEAFEKAGGITIRPRKE
jgi:hypothetical protein